MIRQSIRFYGRVQHVGFRWVAAKGAQTLGLTGYVENLPDGTVHMEVQGREAMITKLLIRLNHDDYIRVDWIDAKNIEVVPDEKKFMIKR